MSRVIFSKPIDYTELEMNLEALIRYNNGTMNDSDLTYELKEHYGYSDITERDIRMIVERLNYDKYKGIDNKFQYRKIKGKYTVIDLVNSYRKKVVQKIKTDAMAALERWRITEHKLGDVNLMNLTVRDILNMEEE